MKALLPDGTELELEDGATGADAARAIGEGLARAALGIKVNGELRDLGAPLEDGAQIAIVTARDEDGLWLIRHDAAHVLATAVLELYPGVKISIGPPIEDGFYYDFDFPDGTKLTEDDFERIEAKMREHVKADEHFEREDVTVAEAIERFRGEGQDYKVELIEDLVKNADPAEPVETVSLYRNGPFTDLCRGPHGPGTKRIKAFKLTSVAGAYWRGDADRQMLTRVYGTAWASKEQLEEHLRRLEEARARDRLELERLDALGRGRVRALAQVGERAVRVERDRLDALVLDEVLDELDLVRLVLGAEALERLVDGDVLAHERLVGLDVLAHLLLDALEVRIADRHAVGELEVVVEAVLDRRADRDPHAGIELHHRGREHVRGVVADDVERLVTGRRDDAELPLAQRRGEVADLPVLLDRQRGAGEPGADRGGGIGAGGAVVELERLAVGKGDLHPAGSLGRRRAVLVCDPPHWSFATHG